MALPNNIDPLESVVTNCPDWLKRLEELSGQIRQRQNDLAKFSEPQSSARSIRNRGSTESLKPQDDGAAFIHVDPAIDAPLRPVITDFPPTPNGPARGREPPPTPASDPRSNHTNEIVAAAQRRARAAVRKPRKTDSMISVEGSRPKYRSRRMVLVYYDSFVQSFFEELVKFVSAQRNMMRKAKMAAKVAHIRRLAEMEMPEDESDEAGETSPSGLHPTAGPISSGMGSRPEGLAPLTLGTRPLRSANFMPTRGARNNAFNGRLGYFNEKGDIWDKLDKGLEFVQGMCEHAAHQFLRDGDCNEEIARIKARLVEVSEAAAKEKERAAQENTSDGRKPDDQEDEPIVKARTYRPATVRTNTGASTTSKTSAREDVLEIDEGIQIEDMDEFKPVYRSTRLMRNAA